MKPHILFLLFLAGCTTVTAPDGTKTTTTDTASIIAISDQAIRAYKVYRNVDGKTVVQPVVK